MNEDSRTEAERAPLRLIAPPGADAVHARWDEEAEVSVLGAVLLDESVLSIVAGIVQPGDFFNPAHALMFESMVEIRGRGESVHPITLAADLRARDRLRAVGGMQLIHGLTDRIPTIAHAERHAQIVADHARARRLGLVGKQITALAEGHAASPDDIESFAYEEVRRAGAGGQSLEHSTLDDACGEAIDKTTDAADGKSDAVPTGFRELDRLLAGGMHPGQSVVIAARPAMGKTSWILQVCAHVAAATQKQVLFFSLEMPRAELGQRILSLNADVPLALLRSGEASAEQMERVTQMRRKLKHVPLAIFDQFGSVDRGFAPPMVARAAAKLRSRLPEGQEIGLIAIDYLQLMSIPGMESREREISTISRGLKLLAKELGVPIVSLSQLNRGPESRAGKDKRPTMADLRESGAIEQDADVVIFIYRDEVYNKNSEDRGIAELIVAKQRNGPTDTVRLRFIREFTRFENLALDPGEGVYGDARASIAYEPATNDNAREDEPDEFTGDMRF